MTRPTATSRGPRRGRRALVALGLVAVFASSLAAGWAISDSGALGAGFLSGPATASPGAPPPASPDPGATATDAIATPTPTAPTPSAPVPSAPPTHAPSATPGPVEPPALAARLDRALARARKSLALPGVEATVTFADGWTWTGALGMADVATERRVRPETPFAVASVTKTFTAALILRYVDEGRIRLDDRLSDWLPDWPNGRKIRIRMLLNHTSGIPDFFRNPKIDAALNRNKQRVWSDGEILERFVRPGAVFAPGKGWSYSNTNYVLLGMVAEQVGGGPWEELVHRELIDPLGLTATYVQHVDRPAVLPAQANLMISGSSGPVPRPRTDATDVVPFTSVVTAAGSAGAIASTSQDLARWARDLYGGTVLTSATRREMLRFVKAYSYGYVTSYGLGVSRVSFEGRTAYGHTGALTGTRAAIRYFPEEKIAIAVLFNRENYVGDDVVRILARALFPAPDPSASPGASASPTIAP